MNSPDPVPQTPIPWYKSQILLAILTAVVAQGLLRLKTQFHLDLTLYGVDANGAANWLMDIISAAAMAWAYHARVAKPLPPIGKPPTT